MRRGGWGGVVVIPEKSDGRVILAATFLRARADEKEGVVGGEERGEDGGEGRQTGGEQAVAYNMWL